MLPIWNKRRGYKRNPRASQYFRKGYLDALRNWHGPIHLEVGDVLAEGSPILDITETFEYYDYIDGLAAGANDKYLASKGVELWTQR